MLIIDNKKCWMWNYMSLIPQRKQRSILISIQNSKSLKLFICMFKKYFSENVTGQKKGLWEMKYCLC
jgi:hypothetical protein